MDLSTIAVGAASATPVSILRRAFSGERVFEMDQLKGRLVGALRSVGRRTLVVIDDIDRLSQREILKLFGLIKTAGSLPWVTYLLCFDKAVVIRALAGMAGGRGNDYLEKIVQFSFDLPLPDRSQFRSLLLRKLTAADIPLPEEAFRRIDRVDVLDQGIITYLDTLRNLYRLTNVLTFTFGLVKERVDPPDFVVLEAIRVFEPAAFGTVRDYPQYFAGLAVPDGAADFQEVGRFHTDWMDELKLDGRTEQALQVMLGFLFPLFTVAVSAARHRSEFEGVPAELREDYDRRHGALGLCNPDVLSYVLSLPLK
jgi:predicted KAP-like P-loop ATPase